MSRYRPSTDAADYASDEDVADIPKYDQTDASVDGGVSANSTGGLPQRETASEHDARDVALRAELASVQRINRVIEGVVASLAHAKANMAVRRTCLLLTVIS